VGVGDQMPRPQHHQRHREAKQGPNWIGSARDPNTKTGQVEMGDFCPVTHRLGGNPCLLQMRWRVITHDITSRSANDANELGTGGLECGVRNPIRQKDQQALRFGVGTPDRLGVSGKTGFESVR
jgi:hypothetical protein